MLKSFSLENVHLMPGLFQERADVNRNYLMELSTAGLLQNFYLEAVVRIGDDAEPSEFHWGWEAPSCQLRGHFLGHWLSAAAVLSVTQKDTELKAKMDKIVDELDRCQELNGGKWCASVPEKYFEKLAKDEYVWSPQYTVHKTLLGLMHVYQYTDNKKALKILDGMADWYTDWVADMQTRNPHAVYGGEEGGMLEVWATLYQLTGQDKYLNLANAYAQPSLFRKLLEGQDALTNCHQNASIPFAHGAAKMYEITGEQKWLDIILAFWKCGVTDRGAYCTGGQGAGEFWVPPHMQGRFLSDRNQEFCTVYNMVRLADYLYRFTGDKKYTDYIEKNLYNGFLAQQNKVTGMPTYFLPMRPGSKKKWGSKTSDFWCCYGTMVQAQTLYPSLCYYADDANKKLLVNQYIPSEVQWGDVRITQNTDMKYYAVAATFDEKDEGQMSRWQLKFTVSAKKQFALSFRIPEWVSGAPVVTLNGETFKNYTVENEYLIIDREWNDDKVGLYFPAGLQFSELPDMPGVVAVLEGPIVLAGLCDRDEGLYMESDNPEEVLMPQIEHTYSTFPWLQSTYQTLKQPKSLRFVPLYDVTDETYTLYFTKRKL